MGRWAAVAPLSCLRICSQTGSVSSSRRRQSTVQRGVYIVNEAFGGMMQRCQEVRANPTTAYRMRPAELIARARATNTVRGNRGYL